MKYASRQMRMAMMLFSWSLLYSHRLNAQVEKPIFLSIDNFGMHTPQNHSRVPTTSLVSSDEEALLLKAVHDMPAFPRYIFSGCDNRAEAEYLLLPSALKPKLMKIWVVTPAKYTETIGGSIHSSRKGDAVYDQVNWGFHVAVAYRKSTGAPGLSPTDGLMVIDPALRPGESVPVNLWFDEMNVTTLTMWTLTDGSVSQFYVNNPPSFGSVNLQAWNGNSFTWSETQDKSQVPQSLARDAVGVQAVSRTSCPALNDLATKPEDLEKALQTGFTNSQGVSVPLGNECKTSLDFFKTETARWVSLLPTQ